MRVRCNGDAFEISEAGKWKPFFFKGVNLGAAPPGKFPGEFAISKSQYARWLDRVSELGANAIRTYTLHTPAFYEALLEHNERQGSRKIWLFQGAWFELPEDLDLYNQAFSDEFRAELSSVVDAIHGSASIAPRPGHASGTYSSDVSRWIAGYVIGRECEPYAVLNTDKLHSGVTQYTGPCLAVKKGSPTECWMASMCDFVASHERDRFGWQHPVSFTSWPTLDPITHPTEKQRGGAREYHDEDAASIDPLVIRPTAGFSAGFFATFHAYPYYPDFMNLDPGYSSYVDEHGFCNYGGYLHDLKAHLRGIPLLIGETGVSTSRGIAHFQPQGLNHGGASEKTQGLQDARLIEDCYMEGASGVLIFELFDEWFKANWLVKDFEIPPDRGVLWQNVQDPEEFFGLLAEEPPAQSDSCFVDWSSVDAFYEDRADDFLARAGDVFDACRDLKELRVASDSRYLYLRIGLSSLDCDRDGLADLDSLNLLIGFDTIDRQRGDTRFPLVRDVSTDAGMEFVLYVESADSAAVLVDSGYNFSKFSRVTSDFYSDPLSVGGVPQRLSGAASSERFLPYSAPFRSRANSDGKFVCMIVETNRDRADASGKVYPAIHLNVGKLTCTTHGGRVDVASGDWRAHASKNFVEMRIPWAILSVTDPSSRQVLDDVPETRGIESTETDGIVLSVLSLIPARAPGVPSASSTTPVVCDAMPDLVREGRGYKFSLDDLRVYGWQKWDTATYIERRKASFDVLSSAFSSLSDSPLPSVRARFGTWPGDCDAAVSVSFDDGTANQIEYALPILQSLDIKATFGLCAAWTGQVRKEVELTRGCVREQLSIGDAKKLISLGHEIASHGYRHVFLDTLPERELEDELGKSRLFFEQELGNSAAQILHYPFSRVNERVKEAVHNAGFIAGRDAGRINSASPDEFLLQSVSIVSDESPSSADISRLFAELSNGKGWLILTFHNVLPSSSREARCYMEIAPEEPYFVTPAAFRKLMEKVRDGGFYVAPEGEVIEYIRARNNATLIVREERNKAIIKVQPLSAENKYEKDLDLIIELPWKKVRVEGSLSDSRYSVSGGKLKLKVAVGSEVTLWREDLTARK